MRVGKEKSHIFFDLFTCDRFSWNILNWLIQVIEYLQRDSKRSTAEHVVTDFSYALINAICVAFSSRTFNHCINMTDDIVTVLYNAKTISAIKATL